MRDERLRPTAVLLDALGTLVELQPPAPRLRRRLAEEGFSVSEEQATAGFTAEISYYLAHHLEGSDRERLDDLRDRCATAMMEALDLPGLDHATARWAMLGSLEFTPFPDAAAALEVLGDRGVVVVSNWDCSLPGWLECAGLPALPVVTSAEVGAAKPDPAIFRHALEVVGVEAADAVHVGDSLENDVEGARGAGIRPVLVRREGDVPPGVEAVRALTEVLALV
ncbi:MAG: HAD family hydrolase [Thermoleophilaceae bacterium]